MKIKEDAMKKIAKKPINDLYEYTLVLNPAGKDYNMHLCETFYPHNYYAMMNDEWWIISSKEADNYDEVLIKASEYFGIFLQRKSQEELLIEERLLVL